MKINKYPQSCFLIEANNKRILIDPGNLKFEEKWIDDDWKDIDVVLVTHKHSDHCYVEVINTITKRDNIQVYTTQEVSDFYSDLENVKVVKQDDVLEFYGVKVEVVKAVHGYHPLFRGRGKMIDNNIGFIIDDGKKRFYEVGDSLCFENNFICDIIAIPVSNHGVTMGSWEASYYAKDYDPELVIPVHSDSPKHPVNDRVVEKDLQDRNLNYKFLEIGESVEL